MDLVQFILSTLLLGLAVEACQDAWVLNSNDLTSGNTISFKNITIIGKRESLSWTWTGKYAETWENKVSHSLDDGNMEGTLIYKSTRRGQKMQASLSWTLNGKQFSWVNSNKEIFNSFWSLHTCQGINMKFHSNKDGFWQFSINDYVIKKDNDKNITEFISNETDLSRKKRSEDFEINESLKNVTTKEGGVFDCILNFFFGGEDSESGRTDGFFTRIKNWARSLMCRLRGDCDGDVPSSEPPITIPPVNPDAESFQGGLPSSSDNDV